MTKFLSKLAAAQALLFVSASVALSQVAKPDRASGPSGGDMVTDLGTWFSNHKGAGIAIGLGTLVAIGLFVYNRMRPDTPSK